MEETFYGLLAGQRLGIAAQPIEPDHQTGAAAVYPDRNAQRALALLAIGERDLAEQFVRHGAALDHAQRHDGWVAFAEQLGLPDAQVWITRNAPVAHHPSVRDRYPNPGYRPVRGWRVDRSLVYAHALQESGFNAGAVSHANAHGLMQVRPGTAGDIARQRGYTFGSGQLHQPEYSIEFGQSYLEDMRDFPATRGLLPQVIAAYNAGPAPIRDWQYSLRDGGDPLLYIESIPYYETRQYVPIVLRNYWMYQRTGGEDTPTLSALAQGMWPRFPGSAGPVAVRMSDHGSVRLGD
ncbi:MAG: lytic transglycosylase domain-containing protein [Sphingomonadales bacterium]|nr:lytic transglycosylase domain-containing protein [Sphingomonadales bacterium]